MNKPQFRSAAWRSLLLPAGLALAAGLAQGQSFTGHYPIGVEGIKGGSLPPPGLYLRDYNYFYFSDRLEGAPVDLDLFVYVNAPRLIWITPLQVLGGNYGLDVLVPLAYTDIEVGGYSGDGFGVGDIFVEPVTLSWHWKQFDLGVGYGFWVPSGDSDPNEPEDPGKGYWSHMFTLGGTWFVDQEKTWAVSVLNRYEIHTENDDWDITPGNTYSLEWGLSKTLGKVYDLGVVGYYQQQTTEDDGPGASDVQDHVFAVGPEVGAFCGKLKLFATLRYEYEFEAQDRPEGHAVILTLTKIW